MVEEKETISLNEFKAWLVGLIRGKKGALPDLDDWKQIKAMIDKIEPDVTFIPQQPYPQQPSIPDPIYPHGPVWVGDDWWIKNINWTTDGTSSDKITLYNNTTASLDSSNIVTATVDANEFSKLFDSWDIN